MKKYFYLRSEKKIDLIFQRAKTIFNFAQAYFLKGRLKGKGHRHAVAYYLSSPPFRHKMSHLQHYGNYKSFKWNATLMERGLIAITNAERAGKMASVQDICEYMPKPGTYDVMTHHFYLIQACHIFDKNLGTELIFFGLPQWDVL